MLLVFRGFAVPDPLYLGGLLAATAIVATTLYAMEPRVSQRTVLAMVPWVVVGAGLHVFYQVDQQVPVDAIAPPVRPLFAAPAVYLTTFVLMGAVWLAIAMLVSQSAAASSRDVVARYLGTVGVGVAAVVVAALAWQSLDPIFPAPRLVMPVLGLLASLVVAAVVYLLLGAWRTYLIAEARIAGGLVVFSHAFDGITTMIGVDVLGTTERSYLPEAIIEFGADLPTAPYLGSAWLFVAVKVLLAVFVVILFADYAVERPRRANLLFALVAFVGLGPALNNFLLFTLGL